MELRTHQYDQLRFYYSGPRSNTSLNCMGPLVPALFSSIVDTTIQQDPWLVEFTDVEAQEEPRMWRNHIYRKSQL